MTCFWRSTLQKKGPLNSNQNQGVIRVILGSRFSLHRFHGFFQHRSPPEPHRQGSPGLKWRWYQETSTGKNPPSERVSNFRSARFFWGAGFGEAQISHPWRILVKVARWLWHYWHSPLTHDTIDCHCQTENMKTEFSHHEKRTNHQKVKKNSR